MASERNGTLYAGVTSNLLRRIEEHKNGTLEWFSKKYHCTFCVYYEYYEHISSAIIREKQIKWWSRKKKLKLIETLNPEWQDLTEHIKKLI